MIAILRSIVWCTWLFAGTILAQEQPRIVTDAWEPEVQSPSSTVETSRSLPPQHLSTEILLKIISYYQDKISKESVKRCPFKTSCSKFAQEAISRHGVLGVLLFIDRYLYRENDEAFLHYKIVENDGGVLKLDDDFFLRSE